MYNRAGNSYQYELTDHLGNVRVVIGGTKQSNGQADVVYYSDYYPYGSPLTLATNDYRYGYQGQYAEVDKETGWNNFELRMYDPAIGRWMTTDPYGQYDSLYVGMGNNPVSSVDPDGGLDGDPPTGDPTKAKPYEPVKVGDQNWVSNGNKWVPSLNEVVISARYTGPNAEVQSVSAGFAFVGGFGFEFGRIKDWKGNSQWFYSTSANIGFGLDVGYNSKEIWSNKKDRSFKISDYQGRGEALSASIGPFGFSAGGDIQHQNSWETNSWSKVVNGFNYYEGAKTASLQPPGYKDLLKGKAGLSAMWSFSTTKLIK